VLNDLMAKDWVVYARHCLNQAETVVDYLARYSHRVAISNGRLLAQEGEQIVFRYKDYRDGDRQKAQQLDGVEFVRRFLMHILPKGFMRIRHFGYLSNRTRRQKLSVIHQALQRPVESDVETLIHSGTSCAWPCTRCDDGMVYRVRQIPRCRTLGSLVTA